MNKLLTVAVALALASSAYAQSATDKPSLDKPGEGEATENKSPFTFEGEVNYKSAYLFRGYNIRDDGLIIQPELTLSYSAYESDGLTVTPYVSLWSNLTDEKYRVANYWDELDVTAGVEIVKGRFTLGLEYLYYTSPGDNFQDVHELGVSLGYDDSEQTPLPFAINPHVALYQEIKNDDRGSEATYLEFGIEPAFDISEKLSLTVPLTLGTGFNDTYQNTAGDSEFFGYASVGIVGKYQINENWYVKAGVEYNYLFADSAQSANDGDEDKFVGTVGIGFSF